MNVHSLCFLALTHRSSEPMCIAANSVLAISSSHAAASVEQLSCIDSPPPRASSNMFSFFFSLSSADSHDQRSQRSCNEYKVHIASIIFGLII